MDNINIASLTENATRLGQRLQESFQETTRDLTITGAASAATYFDTGDDRIKDIRKQLDSSSDREKLDAMKRLIALISRGRNVSEFFAQVVKNVASHNIEIRKLVYIYLLRYAEHEPDLALLSINSFQRDLNDSSPLIRAMALRVLSGIKVPMIGSIVLMAVKKCAADPSPYVRKAAALAIPKCYSLDSSHLPELITTLVSLLRDRSPLSIGTTAVAFEGVCPTRLDLLHSHYRRLCRVLVDVDEWGQVTLVNLLVRYARTMLSTPTGQTLDDLDPDLRLLLDSAEPLFQSRNPAVVLAVVQTFYYLAPSSQMEKVVLPILQLHSSSQEVARVALAYMNVLSRAHPRLFSDHYVRFLVRTDDLTQVKEEKMKLLTAVLNDSNHQTLLREFIDYAGDTDDNLVSGATQAIGKCARLYPDCAQQCLGALLVLMRSNYDAVISSAVSVLKLLVQRQLHYTAGSADIGPSSNSSTSPLSIIAQLAQRLDEIPHPRARACIVWLAGQYAPSPSSSAGDIKGVTEWAPDVLRRIAKKFADESTSVKLQAVTLAAKLKVLAPTAPTLDLLVRYTFSMAKYDTNHDVRDRARLLSSLLTGVAPELQRDTEIGDEDFAEREGVILRKEQVRLILFEGKLGVDEKDAYSDLDDHLSLGTLSAIVGRNVFGSLQRLPDWAEQGAESSLRDTEEDSFEKPAYSQTIPVRSRPDPLQGSSRIETPTGRISPPISADLARDKWSDLDKFYADVDEEDEDEETSEEEDDEDDEGNNGDDSETPEPHLQRM